MAFRSLLLSYLAITLAAALNTENGFNSEFDSSPSEVSTIRKKGKVQMSMNEDIKETISIS